ncbi:zinc finger protein 184-like isoform X2 [Venturia canescens]|uniref:zinc finger protein 184-like isoform X2 n=1 Tax=Venturia canescens TaxID=32260 RepID=UPI001C9D5868|nr:zinc finger protein 184-like isoform X2 [Venturia canescens]
MSSLDYLDLCRLCLVKDRVSVPIFEGEGDVRQIFLKIAACLPVKVGREDKLPKKICDDCVYKVELFYQFWNTTANAEKQLLQWLGEVSMDDKQGYVTGAHDPSMMKPGQNTGENRLDGSSVMQQVNEHTNNMGMGMMDGMGIGMPMMIPNSGQQPQQQQMTSVPMDTGGNAVQNVQPVPGPSAQIGQQKINAPTNEDEDEDESEEEDNSDDECDGDDGLPVKEESEDEPNRTIEPTTFVNVSLACDEAGPSGLQQQKIGEMPEMVMPPTDGDPKSGLVERTELLEDTAETRGMFIYDRESVVMKKWQILEFDGKAYYAFVPENDEPFDTDETLELENTDQSGMLKEEILTDDCTYEDEALDDDPSFYKAGKYSVASTTSHENDEDFQLNDVETTFLNDSEDDVVAERTVEGNLYEVKLEGGLVTLEKVIEQSEKNNDPSILTRPVKQEQSHEISDYEMNETFVEDDESEFNVIEDAASVRNENRAEEEEEEEDEEEVDEEGLEVEEEEEEGGEPHEEFLEEEEIEERLSFTEEKPKITENSGKQELSRFPEEPRTKGGRPTAGPLRCKVCLQTFGSSIAFRKHVAWTHKKKVCIQEGGAYICAVCDYRTLKKSLFAAHLERKHETWTRKRQSKVYFPCETCGFICRSKHSLQSHFIRKHTDRYEHDCQFCSKKFKVKGDLTNHIRFHHKEKPINCDVCGKLCQNTGSLYVHRKWAHYKPKYECHICKRRMVTQENLDQHLITQHEQREKIVCAECGKTFTKKDSFKRHMAVHTGSKPHPCPICSKPFARQSQLRQHVLIHTGQRPFICDICGKGFTQKPGLICHRKTHPGPHPPLPVMPIADLVREFIAQNEESQSHFGELE